MEILTRQAVDQKTTWDLTALYPSDTEFYASLAELPKTVSDFVKTYRNQLTTAEVAVAAIAGLEAIQITLIRLSTYASLYLSQDQSDATAMERSGKLAMVLSTIQPELNFVSQELKRLDEKVLNEIKGLDPSLTKLINDIIRELPHTLLPDVEDALSQVAPTLEAPYQIYNTHKLVEMKFEPVVTEAVSKPMTFGYFEDELAFDLDTSVRRQAFDRFYERLAGSQHTIAAVYNAHVMADQALAKLKKFDSTIDYLLFDQEVTRDLYDRQIDLIMTELAPAMRKFAKLLAEIHQLDKMTYQDLHLVVDPSFEPNITIAEAKEQLLAGLGSLGSEYQTMISRAFDERWIDFPQNQGKSTGAFCSSPYGVHPYVLISWTHKMREVFVLAHELGHAGHFFIANQAQRLVNTRPSLYFIEAPSTMNELLMANHLLAQADNPRYKRWILSTLISRTYYHNFVTHLLEAAYQREVYLRLDRQEPLSAPILNQIYKQVLTDFWGEAVEISAGAELTWMRQPHYYMGLYPYTYSAGLTIATEASQKILKQKISIDDWKAVLAAGGTKNPIELAQMVKVDLTTEQPLRETIKFISDLIDEIISLTAEINQANN